MPRVIGSSCSNTLFPNGFQDMGFIGEKSMSMVTKGVGVKVVVSTGWLVLQ